MKQSQNVAHYQTLEVERVRRVIETLAAHHGRQLKVLDFGCGTGKYLELFAEMGCDVTGVDINPDYVARAKERGQPALTVNDFLGATGLRYDVVFLSHLIEHVDPDGLVGLIPRLCDTLDEGGHLIIITPVPGDRFYHDFSHVRPYLPQSIRHAFGGTSGPLSFGGRSLVTLVDIYFFKDPFRTRHWRSFYVRTGFKGWATGWLNAGLDLLWLLSSGRIGVTASWLGVYRRSAG